VTLKIITGFDGSCPHSDKGVEKINDGEYVVYPSWREVKGIDEEESGCGSRFYIKIENNSDNTAELLLTADWATPKRVEHHDYGFVRHESEDEWIQLTGIRNGATKIKYHLQVRPGITELGLLPAYNFKTLTSFLVNVKKKGFSVETVGKSGQGRDISLISLPSENRNALNFFIQARDHAYETAGSYCVEGMVDFLHGSSCLSNYLKSKFNFFIMPMTNPDGVYKGLSRLTYENGLNVDRFWWNEGKGPESEIIIKTLDRVKPSVYMDIHNYALKFVDAILISESTEFVEKILQHIPSDYEHHKRWVIQTEEAWFKRNKLTERPKNCKGGRSYCQDSFDTLAITFELTWFCRNAALMRKRGVQALIALALASVEELKI